MGFIGKQPSKAAITSSDITDGVVTADKLASDSVTTAKIADNGVTTAKINADAVTDAKIADDVVGTEHLTAGEVDTTALGADSVTAAKIADDAISDEHLDVTAITGQTAETSIATDDLILISDTSASGALKKMTRANFVSGVGGTNTPAFLAYANSDQANISQNTYTKLTNFGAEVFDTDNTFSSSRFTPGVAGKYFMFGTVYTESVNGSRAFLQIRKNGSSSAVATSGIQPGGSSNQPFQVSSFIESDDDDYFELFLNCTGANSTAYSSGAEILIGAFRIIT